MTRTDPKVFAPRWFVAGDLDGFFALFSSSLPDLLVMVGLASLCGFTGDFVERFILPGVAISVVYGNLFYAWQAHRLASKTGRSDVTAIPFGINTPTVFAYIFLIMLPVYTRTHDPALAWRVGVFACFISGVVQTAGAFCTDWLRRHTPLAALLCPLAGIALAYLCLDFILGVFEKPAVALFPAIVLLVLYASRLRLPLRFPAGLLCLLLGALLVVVLRRFHVYSTPALPVSHIGFHPPQPVHLFNVLSHSEGWRYLSVILPLSLLDALVSLQILESVRLAGDDYPTTPSLLTNGLATLLAACLGSPFPTTLYFGHMAFKNFGARTGYSILSGLAVSLVCMTGLVSLTLRFVPVEVVAIIVVWFGLLMVGQAFREVPSTHAVAVAFGLIPMLAAWGLSLVNLALTKAGATLYHTASQFGDQLPVYGLIALSQGAPLISMLWAAVLALSFERRFLVASGWMAAAAILSSIGVIHAYTLTPDGLENRFGLFSTPAFTLSYLAATLALLVCHFYAKRTKADVKTFEANEAL